MSEPQKLQFISVEEYVKMEERATVRHEYYDGTVHAMTGSTGRHRMLCANIYFWLRAQLEGSRCRVDLLDAMVSVKANNCYYYPDIVVSCGKFLPDSMQVERPVFIVEVLSTSTAATDRREKLSSYKKLNSLKEYLVVHQKFKRLELHQRQKNSEWETLVYTEGMLLLKSLPCGALNLPIETIYKDVEGVKSWKVLEDSPNYSVEYLEQEGAFGW